MATHGDIGLSQPIASTITARLDAITLDANSTVVMREVMVIGSPETTNALAAVLASTPKSTDFGLAVRVVSGPSTFTDLSVMVNAPSTANAATFLPVRLTDGSSYLTPGNEYTNASTYSSFAGPTISYDNSSQNTMRTVGVSQPLPVQIRTFSGGGGAAYQSTGASTVGGNSTGTTIVSSVAAVKTKVYAYSVTSTVASPSTCSFRSSNGQVLWPITLGSASSGVTGANLAVTPPAFLFATETANALTFHTPSAGPEYAVSVSYFQES